MSYMDRPIASIIPDKTGVEMSDTEGDMDEMKRTMGSIIPGETRVESGYTEDIWPKCNEQWEALFRTRNMLRRMTRRIYGRSATNEWKHYSGRNEC